MRLNKKHFNIVNPLTQVNIIMFLDINSTPYSHKGKNYEKLQLLYYYY